MHNNIGNAIAFVEGNIAMIIGLILLGDITHIALLSFKAFILALIGGVGGVIGKNFCEWIVSALKTKYSTKKRKK